jgi:uncharacterized membrane protein
MNALLTGFVPIALGLWIAYLVASDQRPPFSGLAGGARIALFFVVGFCAAGLLREMFGLLGSAAVGNLSIDSLLGLIIGVVLIVITYRLYTMLGGEVSRSSPR